MTHIGWPTTATELETLQRELARFEPPAWSPDLAHRLVVVGVLMAGPVGLVGTREIGDPLWAGSVAMVVPESRPVGWDTMRVAPGRPYVPGLLGRAI